MDDGARTIGLKQFFSSIWAWFKNNKWARTCLTIVFIIMPMAFLIRNLAINWQSLQKAAIQIKWGRVLISLLILQVSFTLLPLGTLLSLRAFGISLDFRDAYYAYHASQLGKYLPGRIWIIPGRAVLLRGFGIDPILGGAGALLETYLLIVTGVLVFQPYLFLVPQTAIRQVAIIGLLFCIPALLISFFPKILNRVLSFLLKMFKRPPVIIAYSWKQLLMILMVYICFWGISGSGFFILLNSFTPLSGQTFFQTIGVLGFSWVIGFISFLTPAGIGVREGAMSFLLAPIISPPFPALMAIISRIWWSLADLTSIWIAFVLSRKKKR